MLSTRAGRVAVATVAVLVAATAAGLIALWPTGERATRSPVSGMVEQARVVTVTRGGCEALAGPGCRVAEIELRSGAEAGRRSRLALADEASAPPLEPGDRIRVTRNAPAGDGAEVAPYAFSDFERRNALLVLTVLFAALIVGLGRWQGLRALVGLGISLLIAVGFIVPSILDGNAPLAVALVGGLAVSLVTTLLTYGVGPKSVAAMLGIALALGLTALLALVWVDLAHLTGLSSEESVLLAATTRSDLSLQGLVLAGFVIGALGVLDDVTVTQASTVLALRRANPRLGARRLFGEALQVGRDHLGATVNTLALVYVGASLTALVIFTNQQTSVGDAVNSEPVAEQIVAALVGSLGLIAAVPLTTALAAVLAVRLPVDALPSGPPAHEH